MSAVEISSDPESGLGLGGTGIVEDLLVRIQGFARPVAGDFGEEAMLDRVPFGSASGIVSNGYGQGKGVGQLGLELGFPGMTAVTVAATGIGQNDRMSSWREPE